MPFPLQHACILSAPRRRPPAAPPARRKVKRDAVAEKQAITVIAFRGQNRSEAQYVVSASAAASQGTGVVQQLSLMVAWDRGTFNGFTWYNSGPCDTCGGLSNARCVQTQYEPYVQRYPQSSCACECCVGAGVASACCCYCCCCRRCCRRSRRCAGCLGGAAASRSSCLAAP